MNNSYLRSYEAYKPSSVPWLGDVPEHWNVRRGGWLFHKMDRPVHDNDEVITCFRDGRVTLRKNRRMEGFTESLQEIGYQSIRKGDLVIHQMDAFAGAVGVSDSDGKGTPVYSVCRPTQFADSFYFAHIVREMARNQWILALAKGIRERSTDFRYSEFARQLLPLPPLDEQRAIVRCLDHVDDRIRRYVAAKEKLIALLEEERQAVIHRAVTRGLDPNVPLKPSGVEWLGNVPAHWGVRPLSGIADSFRTGPFGSMLHQSDYIEGGTPVINPVHMREGAIVEDLRCSVPETVADRLFRYRLGLHDLLFARRGELGRCALVRSREYGWLCGTGSIRVHIEYEGIEPEFLIQALQVSWVGEFLSLVSVGATMENLNTAILKGVPILIPPIQEQRDLLEHIGQRRSNIDAAIGRARRQIELLREYRTRLIADVVTGKLDVREAAAKLGEQADGEDPIDEAIPMADNMDDSLYNSDESAGELAMEREVAP